MRLAINAIPIAPGGGLTVLLGLLEGWREAAVPLDIRMYASRPEVLNAVAERFPDIALEAVAVNLKPSLRFYWQQVRLVIVGDGPYRKQAEQKVAELDISNNVQFKGWILPNKVAESLADCDLMVALYERTPAMMAGGINPMKVWTALAIRKPVLLYNPGSYDEYSKIPGIFTVPSADPEKVAHTVEDLWQRYGRRGLANAGLMGREYVVKNVTWLKHAEVIDKTIRQALHALEKYKKKDNGS